MNKKTGVGGLASLNATCKLFPIFKSRFWVDILRAMMILSVSTKHSSYPQTLFEVSLAFLRPLFHISGTPKNKIGSNLLSNPFSWIGICNCTRKYFETIVGQMRGQIGAIFKQTSIARFTLAQILKIFQHHKSRKNNFPKFFPEPIFKSVLEARRVGTARRSAA